MAIDNTKFIEVCENVAGMREGLTKTGENLERVEKKVDAQGIKLVKIQKKINGGVMSIDQKALIKYGLILIALLVGSSAGGAYVQDLIKIIMGM